MQFIKSKNFFVSCIAALTFFIVLVNVFANSEVINDIFKFEPKDQQDGTQEEIHDVVKEKQDVNQNTSDVNQNIMETSQNGELSRILCLIKVT